MESLESLAEFLGAIGKEWTNEEYEEYKRLRRNWLSCKRQDWTTLGQISHAAEQVLQWVDHLVGGCGVEAVECGDDAILYVNRGDSYAVTMCYCEYGKRFVFASWGDLVEEAEQAKQAEQEEESAYWGEEAEPEPEPLSKEEALRFAESCEEDNKIQAAQAAICQVYGIEEGRNASLVNLGLCASLFDWGKVKWDKEGRIIE